MRRPHPDERFIDMHHTDTQGGPWPFSITGRCDPCLAEAWERMTYGGVGYPVFTTSPYSGVTVVDLCVGAGRHRTFNIDEAASTTLYHVAN